MKKYTIIYSIPFQYGSSLRGSSVKLKYIICKPEDIVQSVEQKRIDFSWVNYILDGHCKQSED